MLQKRHMFVRETQGQEVEEREDKGKRAVRESGSKAGVNPSPYCGQGFEDAPCQRHSVSGDTGTAHLGFLQGYILHQKPDSCKELIL